MMFNNQCAKAIDGCPIAELCAELRLDREAERSTMFDAGGVIDQTADTVQIVSPFIKNSKQYDDSLYEAMSALKREYQTNPITVSSDLEYNKKLLDILDDHGIPAEEMPHVLIGKLIWTTQKASEEARDNIAIIDSQLAELDQPSRMAMCITGVEVVERDGKMLRMCGSTALSVELREELARP